MGTSSTRTMTKICGLGVNLTANSREKSLAIGTSFFSHKILNYDAFVFSQNGDVMNHIFDREKERHTSEAVEEADQAHFGTGYAHNQEKIFESGE